MPASDDGDHVQECNSKVCFRSHYITSRMTYEDYSILKLGPASWTSSDAYIRKIWEDYLA